MFHKTVTADGLNPSIVSQRFQLSLRKVFEYSVPRFLNTRSRTKTRAVDIQWSEIFCWPKPPQSTFDFNICVCVTICQVLFVFALIHHPIFDNFLLPPISPSVTICHESFHHPLAVVVHSTLFAPTDKRIVAVCAAPLCVGGLYSSAAEKTQWEKCGTQSMNCVYTHSPSNKQHNTTQRWGIKRLFWSNIHLVYAV
jgi:hypothetical protein